MRNRFLFLVLLQCSYLLSFATGRFVVFQSSPGCFPIIEERQPCPILIDDTEDEGVRIAVESLRKDIKAVCGSIPVVGNKTHKRCLIVGTATSPLIQQLFRSGSCERTI